MRKLQKFFINCLYLILDIFHRRELKKLKDSKTNLKTKTN